MDQGALVENGAEGLIRIAEAFRARGLPIAGVYLIKLTSEDGFEDWIIRLVSDQYVQNLGRRMVSELIQLRRESALPRVSPGVRFDVVSSDDAEASRVIDYTRRLGGPPAEIRDAMWRGLFIEYALVASVPQASFAVV